MKELECPNCNEKITAENRMKSIWLSYKMSKIQNDLLIGYECPNCHDYIATNVELEEKQTIKKGNERK